MFDVDELFSKRNVRAALESFQKKPNQRGSDGLLLSDLASYWEANKDSILALVKKGQYAPAMIRQVELLKRSGGSRLISNFAALDRLVLRLLSQKLNRYLDPIFLDNSFAFRDGKGVLAAVMRARDYIREGRQYLVEVDVYHYFDQIPLEPLLQLLAERIGDSSILALIRSYLYCQIVYEGKVADKMVGLVQGSSISPVLSNLYLHAFDCYLEESGLSWMRFADNIYLFCKKREEAQYLYEIVVEKLTTQYGLSIQSKKSGVFRAFDRRILGYDFIKKQGEVVCQKHQYTPLRYYPSWHRSPLRTVDQQYYIVEGGILTKKDFSLLFENEEHRHHLPIEAIRQLDIFSDVVVEPRVMALLAEKRIPVIIHNHLGQIQSYILPESMRSQAPLLLAQSQLYQNEAKRLEMARIFEMTHLHNLRANVRYYQKKHPQPALDIIEEQLTAFMQSIKEKKSVQDLMLDEARARQVYYQLFNLVLLQEGFAFDKRTKRPPRDPLNALISFCNTVLYSQVLKAIWNKGLDPKISVLHASTNRPYSLQLDFADYMKPIIVDRVIFSLINRHQIQADNHFEQLESGAVLLNVAGKRLVLAELEEKLHTRIVVKGTSYSYYQLIERDVGQFKKLLMGDPTVKRFKPYKYY